MAVLAGSDFFTVEVLTWRRLATYYVLFFIHLETRRITLAGITRHPPEAWMTQMARNAVDDTSGALRQCRYVLGSVAASGGRIIDMTHRRRRARNPSFRKRWFADDSIIQCVHWYLRFKISYRDLSEIMRQLGVSVAPSSILRWVIRYSIVFAESMGPLEKHVGLVVAV